MIKRLQKALLAPLALAVFTISGTANADVTYFHHDALGSVVAATNESGTVLWRESYQPFGERLDKAVSTDQHAFYYTGKPHDDRTGLTYFGARQYDPVIGRFMGIDPAKVEPGSIHSFNRYAYAINNPYKHVDPDGKRVVILGSDAFVKQTLAAINLIKSKPSGKELYNNLHDSSHIHTIIQSTSGNSAEAKADYLPRKGSGSIIEFDPSNWSGGKDEKGSTIRPPFVGLAHELGHAEDIDRGTVSFDWGNPSKKGTTPPIETNSMKRENQIRNEHKVTPRSSFY